MKLSSFLMEGTIEDDLKAKDRGEVIAELSDLLFRTGRVARETDLVAVLQDREELGSTGIGNGIAIPHVRFAGVESPMLVVGRSVGGVEFGAIDDLPVHLFFLLVTPSEATGDHLKALAGISRFLKKTGTRQALLDADGVGEMRRIIEREDEEEQGR